jgi:hypothetical protein
LLISPVVNPGKKRNVGRNGSRENAQTTNVLSQSKNNSEISLVVKGIQPSVGRKVT